MTKLPDSAGWWARNGALLLPLLLVNAAAIYGQVGWAYEHLRIDGRQIWAVAILFALALESVGFYLAAEAHSAAVANQSSARLRWASYAVALLVGALNYAHFANPGLRPNAIALAFGGLSVISPWLWAIRSRSLSRTQLLAAGLLDARAVKFTFAQWMLYPVRTFKAFRAAVWVSETDPARARRLVDEPPAVAPAPVQAAPVELAEFIARPARISPVRRPQPIGRLAGRPRSSKRPTARTAPVVAPVPAPAPAAAALVVPPPVKTTQTIKAPATRKPRRSSTKKAQAEKEAFQYWNENRQISARQLAARFGLSPATAVRRVNEWKAQVTT